MRLLGSMEEAWEGWLAGLPQVAAEILEGYFSGWGFHLRIVGYKPQAGVYSFRARKEPK